MVQSVASGCIPFRWAQSAETASYVEDQSSWNKCILPGSWKAYIQGSKVQAVDYLLYFSLSLSLSLSLHRRLNESSRWLKASQGPKQEGTNHICLLAFFGNI